MATNPNEWLTLVSGSIEDALCDLDEVEQHTGDAFRVSSVRSDLQNALNTLKEIRIE